MLNIISRWMWPPIDPVFATKFPKVKSCLNWTNKSYAYASRVEISVGSYEIISEQDEVPFEGQVDVVEYHKTQTKVWKGPRPS
jgi:hypothetical protein